MPTPRATDPKLVVLDELVDRFIAGDHDPTTLTESTPIREHWHGPRRRHTRTALRRRNSLSVVETKPGRSNVPEDYRLRNQ
jgi:hypothetical protein